MQTKPIRHCANAPIQAGRPAHEVEEAGTPDDAGQATRPERAWSRRHALRDLDARPARQGAASGDRLGVHDAFDREARGLPNTAYTTIASYLPDHGSWMALRQVEREAALGAAIAARNIAVSGRPDDLEQAIAAFGEGGLDRVSMSIENPTTDDMLRLVAFPLTELRVIGGAATPDVLRALAAMTSLACLVLHVSRPVGDEGARILASSRSLTTLDLSRNRVGSPGATALAQNRSITAMILADNDIDDAGVYALGQSSTIVSLDLASNRFGNFGAEILSRNRTITSLNLAHNHIDSVGALAILRNSTITTLDLSGNHLGDAGARILAGSRTITSLRLASNGIGDNGAQALARNPAYVFLDLHGNPIGMEGLRVLANHPAMGGHGRDQGPDGG